MNEKLFSIVIANLNYGRFLGAAIRSVIEQGMSDQCELIVVDGGSTDDSVDVIRSYETDIAWWCSEKDRSQSEAFNKGFARSHGKYITWLNADDILLPGALAAVKARILKTNADWFSGNMIRFESATRNVCDVHWGPHVLPRFMQGRGWPVAVFGPTTFWRRSVYERLGRMDENAHYAMDTEYWIRLLVNGYKHVRVNAFCWAFGMHEKSKTAEFGGHVLSEKQKAEFDRELRRIADTHHFHVNPFKHFLYQFWRLCDFSYLRSLALRRRWMGKSLAEFCRALEAPR